MKTVKLTLMLLSVYALMTACSETEMGPKVEVLPATTEFSMRADATCENPGLCDGSSLQVFSGNSASCSMVNTVCYDLDGVLHSLIEDGDFQIQGGKIHIFCPQRNASISGSLHGMLHKEDNALSMEATIILNEKTECFAQVTDILHLNMTGEILLDGRLHYTMEIGEQYLTNN